MRISRSHCRFGRGAAAAIQQMRHTAFVVLGIVDWITVVRVRIGAHQNFVDSFPIHIAPHNPCYWMYSTNRLLAVVDVIGGRAISRRVSRSAPMHRNMD